MPTFTIGSLVNEVIVRCENRITDTSRAAIWLRDSLLEITSDPGFRNEFDQLEILGTPFFLTPQVQEYDESNIVPTGDVNTATLDIMIWQDPGTNIIRRKLGHSNYQKADNFQPSYSLPTEWYRFAANIGLTPIPDQAYKVQARILRQHPIDDTTLTNTVLLTPRDWNEILIWASVERGFMELLEYEKAQAIHVLLYGDPKYPDRPGIINGRKKRFEMEAWRTEEALRPIIRPATFGYGSR